MIYAQVREDARKELEAELKTTTDAKWYRRVKIIDLSSQGYSVPQLAQTFGARIYTIGVGTEGEAPYPVQTPFGTRYRNIPVDVDEETLQTIAEMTGGLFYRATNNRALETIYAEIDQMEKTRIEVKSYKSYTELFYGWAWVGLALLLVEVGLSGTLLRKHP